MRSEKDGIGLLAKLELYYLLLLVVTILVFYSEFGWVYLFFRYNEPKMW